MTGWARLLAVAALAMLASACVTGRQRTFEVNRAGAEEAVRTALKQPQTSSIELTVKPELVDPPKSYWTDITPKFDKSRVVSAVMAVSESGSPPFTMFAPDAEGVAKALAFRDGNPNQRRVVVRMAYDGPRASELHAWQLVRARPTIILDDTVCSYDFDSLCVDFINIRSIHLTSFANSSSTRTFPVTRAGVEAAMRDLATMRPNDELTIEMKGDASRSGRTAYLSAVSTLDDTRICGSGYTPPAAGERCYDFASIRGMRVWDTTRSAGDTVGDIASFPFRLVGALGSSMAIGAH